MLHTVHARRSHANPAPQSACQPKAERTQDGTHPCTRQDDGGGGA